MKDHIANGHFFFNGYRRWIPTANEESIP